VSSFAGNGRAAHHRRVRRRRAVALTIVVLAIAGVLAWRLWPTSVPHTGSAAAHGATILDYDVHSRFVHQSLPQTAAIPAGAADGPRRPLLVFLHGRGGHGNDSNSNGAFYAALDALGDRAPIVVFPNGDEHSYWHKRDSGDWGRYVLDEVIPQAVKRLHADPHRVAIGGISMGGFGAFDVARQQPGEFCAVGGHSAAVWQQAGDSAAGAFDDADDFGRHDVVKIAQTQGRTAWGKARLWLDGGTADPFRTADEALAAALKIPMHHWSGGHDGAYWHGHYARYLRFYAAALAAC
jgi:enterochelin esterase-like enzyme